MLKYKGIIVYDNRNTIENPSQTSEKGVPYTNLFRNGMR